jgi:hypothetical protein
VLLVQFQRPSAPARPMRFDLTMPSNMRIEDYNRGVIAGWTAVRVRSDCGR